MSALHISATLRNTPGTLGKTTGHYAIHLRRCAMHRWTDIDIHGIGGVHYREGP